MSLFAQVQYKRMKHVGPGTVLELLGPLQIQRTENHGADTMEPALKSSLQGLYKAASTNNFFPVLFASCTGLLHSLLYTQPSIITVLVTV